MDKYHGTTILANFPRKDLLHYHISLLRLVQFEWIILNEDKGSIAEKSVEILFCVDDHLLLNVIVLFVFDIFQHLDDLLLDTTDLHPKLS